jgi:DNA-binding response OmpR family regulator
MQSMKCRILCTEDDADTRNLIVFILTQYGFEVVACSGSKEAIGLAKTQDFNLYLVDTGGVVFLGWRSLRMRDHICPFDLPCVLV